MPKPPKHILLGISGGIAAYKSCELVRLLKKQGHSVSVAMSRAATEFVSPQTFQALSGQSVWTDHSAAQGNGMAHINLSREADVFLIAPASANTLAKIAHGLADNLLATLAAARACPLAVAPAMNVEMWRNPANLRNIAQLQADGIAVFGPASGSQACGETGEGRMLEAAELAELLPDLWTPKLLTGQRVLLTAGATFEAIDPVRGITNLSSGRMGVALAQACRAAGAEVVLVAGQLQVPAPAGIAVRHAHSAQEMYDAVMREAGACDVFIGVAAVADYCVANRSAEKLKKDGSGTPPAIELAENPDILAAVARLPNAPFCVGFAAESHHVLEHARAKRLRKGVPLMVANSVADAMGSTSNRVTLISASGETALPEMGKRSTADAIVAEIARLLGEVG
ncbi:bifunctional phosphopantothenoylcysteine decarboxylase/phosphopantothenate--cysteine ligase CoaBC [Eikenella sp. S3360]|uniref:Coenzyme A biosynthesis bifunctional protein CoaBC n=1 Tax=Eikenella glucosivorans TaxID=2766967 RepID=A0ABS0N7Z1_9NEIS|nr:bifunctional phosphopantothenoylcysteine decarboxylase/phosphopantothenate--cysteine ligase CoaBC [Eikenella glucosivorans]MBH5328428.1 bifunctional phosphopantothenoylcysteine decarboxylase/phosphopantothenate--cysteine ligase CoaBC [Eikenella glucosivorans]